MKLILCPKCSDIRALARGARRRCMCGLSWGKYLKDGLNAVIGGKAIPLGFANGSLIDAIFARPDEGLGSRFIAFVIPKSCPTVKEEKC